MSLLVLASFLNPIAIHQHRLFLTTWCHCMPKPALSFALSLSCEADDSCYTIARCCKCNMLSHAYYAAVKEYQRTAINIPQDNNAVCFLPVQPDLCIIKSCHHNKHRGGPKLLEILPNLMIYADLQCTLKQLSIIQLSVLWTSLACCCLQALCDQALANGALQWQEDVCNLWQSPSRWDKRHMPESRSCWSGAYSHLQPDSVWRQLCRVQVWSSSCKKHLFRDWTGMDWVGFLRGISTMIQRLFVVRKGTSTKTSPSSKYLPQSDKDMAPLLRRVKYRSLYW